MSLQTVIEIGAGIAGAVAVVVVGLWLGKRQADRLLGPDLTAVLNEKDPVVAKARFERHIRDQASKEEAERRELWEKAQVDLDAARELRRRLMEDVATDGEVLKEFGAGTSSAPGWLSNVQAGRQEGQVRVAEVDALIRRLEIQRGAT